ncbi:YdbH domain-containing protein [Novosphingobium bradum]|uniref:YdbH domain-containing protein n=1 Tax=Novosphingobium bradum TaxID=1737444 RepID=A0ABV7IQA2_9SPHN
MSEATDDRSDDAGLALWPEQQGPEPGAPERRARWLRVAAVAGGVVALGLGTVWLARERIADDIIASQLRSLGLKGTWHIDSIGPRRQVLSHVVIGDPRTPDLTIARAEIEIEPRLGFPAIGRITLVSPRLHGTWSDGAISFGALDKALFGGQRKAAGLPDIDLAIVDGRGRLTGNHGPIGLRIDGAGRLTGGFAGTLAAVAPALILGSCQARGATLYGQLGVAEGKPRLNGPLRAARLDCPGQGVGFGQVAVAVDATLDKTLDGAAARLGIGAGASTLGAGRASGLNGVVDATWRGGALTARADGLVRGLALPQVRAATVAFKGTLRARDGFARAEAEGDIDAGGLRLGESTLAGLVAAERQGEGSLVAPLLRQLRAAIEREGPASHFAAGFVARRAGGQASLVLPQGRLTGGSGATLLALSRMHYASGPGAPRLAGNFSTGGPGLPRIEARMEQGARGSTVVRLVMAEYRAGDSRIALPQLTIAQQPSGALAFSGVAEASGPLPGGRAGNLVLPIAGTRGASGGLRLWPGCTTVRFDQLAYANLVLDGQALRLCAGPGGVIVRSDAGGTRIALGAPALALSGHLGQTPIRLASGPIGYASPGGLYARALEVALGPDDTATHLRLADLRAVVGREIAGTFAGTEVRIGAVPLDVVDAGGTWRYADGALGVTGATFRLEDRAQVDRFQPLEASDVGLILRDNRISAKALLREPQSRREVAQVALDHDLAAGRGHATLDVPGIVFDDRLRPDMVTHALLGVIANARGTVKGRGEIAWDGDKVHSSGRFGTDSLDFAAAFGPATGAVGTIEFTDLVNFVSKPHQRLTIATMNPGIAVTDGEVFFQLKPGSVLAIEGGTWPLLGGRLFLRPVDLRLGVAETRRYQLDIEGLDAARFVAQMDLANLSATGSFDGTLPLVFDENGGRIEGGVLTSRPGTDGRPAGNVAYVGALTYKDLSPIANFAFDALKSLDYRQMRIAMDGALEGDIVTRVRFDGVKQGAGARRNFLTRRFAQLPLQFNVNLRAPFYQLITSFKAMYDPAYIKDPRTLGLLDARGRPIRRPANGKPTAPSTPIQSSDSENKR